MFNYENLIKLIEKAQGDRTQNAFAMYCGFDSSAISKIKSRKVPPQPSLLKKIALHAQNNVSYIDLMIAAEYLSENDIKKEPTLIVSPQYDEETLKIINLCSKLKQSQKNRLIGYIEGIIISDNTNILENES